MPSSDRPYQLAIETTGRAGSICLGRDGEVISVAELPAPKRGGRTGGTGGGGGGSSELMVAIDSLCDGHRVPPQQLDEVYLSIGPGSFTGLRIGVATVKMMAQVLGVGIVAVPTLNVVAQNASAEVENLAVCLNRKRDTVYAGLFKRAEEKTSGRRGGDDESNNEGNRAGARNRERHTAQPRFTPIDEPSLRTMADLLAAAPRPLAILGDPLPPLPPTPAPPESPGDITILPPALAVARAETVFHLGHAAARAGAFADPLALVPLYVRPPEAVTLWEKRLAEQSRART